mgnify:CR=1 FL=1
MGNGVVTAPYSAWLGYSKVLAAVGFFSSLLILFIRVRRQVRPCSNRENRGGDKDSRYTPENGCKQASAAASAESRECAEE